MDGAIFSGCRHWRYRLWREVNPAGQGRVAFVMLNPSTADETKNDPTIRRCIGYARDWGYRYLEIGNIFAWRSTNPDALRHVVDPVGPGNDSHLVEIATSCAFVVAAWGARGGLLARGSRVRRLLRSTGARLCHLGLTDNGYPRHPLYLRADMDPIEWRDAE